MRRTLERPASVIWDGVVGGFSELREGFTKLVTLAGLAGESGLNPPRPRPHRSADEALEVGSAGESGLRPPRPRRSVAEEA
jgi:hypothetical protein